MSDPPPPYVPSVFAGPPTHGYPPDGHAQPPTFPGSVYQSYPQTYGGDHFYQGPPRPPEAYLTQPAYQGYSSGQSGAAFSWDGPKTHGNTSKQPVFTMDQPRGAAAVGGSSSGGGEGMGQSLLAACSATMCCCCLWKMLSQYL